MSVQRVIDVDSAVRATHRGKEVRAAATTPAVLAAELKRHEGDPEVVRRLTLANDLLNINWLQLGLRAARSVARIEGPEPGSGFMVGPSLLLTNNHVLRSEEAAAQSVVVFNDQLGPDGTREAPVRAAFAPDRLFLTSPEEELDATIVAVRASPKLRRFGFLRLIERQGKLQVGDHVTIIQHPQSGPKQVALRSNRVVEIEGHFVRYETDTKGGSSGSPVFNDQWQVVALHHDSVPVRDAEGSPVSRTGLKLPATRFIEEREWLSNEGIRVSSIVRFIRDASFRHATPRRLHRSLLSSMESSGQ